MFLTIIELLRLKFIHTIDKICKIWLKTYHIIKTKVMKQAIIFLYELAKFIVISIPLAILLFVTLTIISKFKNI
jgi:hypothetical protein